MREKKYAIYIDGSNTHMASKAAGYRVDFGRIKAYYEALGSVVDAVYFTALPPKEEFSALRKLTDHLQYNGWTVITKETEDQLTSDGLRRKKGNMDMAMFARGARMAGVITHLVLFTGDGDFVDMVEYMKEKGVHVSAVSHFSYKDDCIVSTKLRKAVNEFWPLTTMRQHFEK